MLFDVGDKVVYPHHGAAIVELAEHAAIGRKRGWKAALPILQWSVTR